MSNIKISSPFFSKLTHQDATIGTAVSSVLTAVKPGEKRILLVVQNQSANVITVILNGDVAVTSGITVQPDQLVSFDNYSGPVRIKADGAGSLVHVAHANV